ncbi:MAG: YybH family protein [bacterium]
MVFDFFESIASFNYPALRDHCTEDFYLFEDGQKMNLNQFINLVKSFEHQATIHYELEDIRTEIAGSLAWMTLRTKALMNLNGQGTNLEWLESAVLKKQQDLWRIAFYHSSVVKGKEPSKS